MLSNPTVGLSAHAGSVDIRITAKAEDEAQADVLIAPVEEELHQRLGDWIYGADEDTLENVALSHLDNLGWKMAVVEAGLGGRLNQRLAETGHPNFLGWRNIGWAARPGNADRCHPQLPAGTPGRLMPGHLAEARRRKTRPENGDPISAKRTHDLPLLRGPAKDGTAMGNQHVPQHGAAARGRIE